MCPVMPHDCYCCLVIRLFNAVLLRSYTTDTVQPEVHPVQHTVNMKILSTRVATDETPPFQYHLFEISKGSLVKFSPILLRVR
jgi:hypothetical protein